MPEEDSGPSKDSVQPLSCHSCRRRKIKCNKQYPCNNCTVAGEDCIFPTGRKRPRNSRNALLDRLRTLESTVQVLQKSTPQNEKFAFDEDVQQDISTLRSAETPAQQDGIQNESEPSPQDFGQLRIHEDRSRYSSNRLWASLSQEITEMKSLIEEFQADDGDESSQGTPSDQQGGASAILFNSASPESQPLIVQVNPTQFEALWGIYTTNVDPVVKIFHRPSLRRSLVELSQTNDRTSKRTHDLLLDTICFAAIVSSTDAECQAILGTTKATSLQNYRSELERRFGHANLPNTSSLIVLQAFVLFLTCMQRLDESRLVLGWTALAVRIAMCQGLHRDGDTFGLTSFESEIRRRIWWHLISLEYDLSKGHGVDTLVQKASFTTKLPSNLNDDDITLGMPSLPPAKPGFSEMSHSLVRFEIFHQGHDLIYAEQAVAREGGRHGSDLRAQENQILDLQNLLERKYLQYCSANVPIQFATAVLARSLCAMLWMSIYHPLQLSGDPRASSLKDQLFTSMIEVVDNIRRLESDPQTAQWGWYFHNDTQWPALTYLLNELKRRPPGPQMNRAFEVARAARTQWYATNWSTEFHHKMHKPMKLLTTQVLAQGGPLDVDPNSEEYANSIVRERGWDPRLNTTMTISGLQASDQMFDAEDFDAWLQQEQGAALDPAVPISQDMDASSIAHFEAHGRQFGASDWWFTPYQPPSDNG